MLRALLLAVTIFATCWSLALAFWWQTNYQVTLGLILVYLMGLPALLVGVFVGVPLLYKKITNPKPEENVDTPAKGQETKAPALPYLLVLDAGINCYLGDSAEDILQELPKTVGPEIDPLLKADGEQYRLSRRVDLDEADGEKLPIGVRHYFVETSIVDTETSLDNANIDSEENVTEMDLTSTNSQDLTIEKALQVEQSPRLLRMALLLQMQVENMGESFNKFAKILAEASVWHQPATVASAELHPAWKGDNATTLDAENDKNQERAALHQGWPGELSILHIVPIHIGDEEQQSLSLLLFALLEERGISKNAVTYVQVAAADADATLEATVQALQKIHINPKPACLLIIGADSRIDEEWLDEQDESAYYVATEGAVSMFVANVHTVIQTMPPIAQLTRPVLCARQKPITAVGRVGAAALSVNLENVCDDYHLDPQQLVVDEGFLLSDIYMGQTAAVNELLEAITPLNLLTEQRITTGQILESANILSPVVPMVMGSKCVTDIKNGLIPVLCHSGNIKRSVIIVAAVAPLAENTDQS